MWDPLVGRLSTQSRIWLVGPAGQVFSSANLACGRNRAPPHPRHLRHDPLAALTGQAIRSQYRLGWGPMAALARSMPLRTAQPPHFSLPSYTEPRPTGASPRVCLAAAVRSDPGKRFVKGAGPWIAAPPCTVARGWAIPRQLLAGTPRSRKIRRPPQLPSP